MPFKSHSEYLKQAPAAVRPLLASVQAKVESLLPDAERCISYDMPAYRIGQRAGTGKRDGKKDAKAKRTFFYFAAFKKHIGIYPPVKGDAALIRELEPYRGPKGNLSFPLDQPLPLALIGRVAVALRREYEAE
jgi:uncharacterized protein YdhG (YjbR/CyaY superfamily)